MPPAGFPSSILIGGAIYKVNGERQRAPSWEVGLIPAQAGDFARERQVRLGDGAAGLIGSRRYSGRPAVAGVADVVNGDVSIEDRYAAGPAVTTISLTSGNTTHAAGSIGGSLSIGGGGAPSIGAGAVSNSPTAIWADGVDDYNAPVRYIYMIVGGRMKVVDPTDDSIVETVEWESVDGGDVALWAGQHWMARRGGATDYVQYVAKPYDGTASTLATTDYTARLIHDGPDALYRGYSNFSGNEALVKRSTSTTTATVAADTNWNPTAGETLGDPSVPLTRLATLGERLVAGKHTGVGEFDTDFTFRFYLEWMKAFRWELNNNAILPLGQGGEFITGYRRGLYLLPRNKAIGTEVLTGNSSDKKGRYTAICYDGNWLYAFQESPATDDTHIIKMRPRRMQGPGLFEHLPIATVSDTEVLTCFIWPGAVVSGVAYGPRMYWGNGVDSLGYIRLGETQPDQDDANARFTTGAWSITWPADDFGNPQTLKMPYKIEWDYENVAGTSGITLAVDDGDGFTNLDNDGSGSGTTAVTSNGFAQRFGPTNNSILGRTLSYRISGTGSSATAQQRANGQPAVYIIEQPETVFAYEMVLELIRTPENDEDATEQWRTLSGLPSSGVQTCRAEWGDEAPGTSFEALVKVDRNATVSAADAPGTILVSCQLRTLSFTD